MHLRCLVVRCKLL